MSIINLELKNADEENFSSFGQLLSPDKPEFSNEDFNWYERLGAFGFGVAEIGLVSARNNGSYRQKVLERHKKTKEVIIPLNDIIIILALGEASEENDFAAFRIPAGKAVAINAGVWHHAPMCLPGAGEAAAFVIYAEGTGSNDKEMFTLSDRGITAEIPHP